MKLNDIIVETNRLEILINNLYHNDVDVDLIEFANREAEIIAKLYNIKESQAMFLVMSAINNFCGK